MSNTPAPAAGNALAALGNLKAGLTNVVTSAPITGGGAPILRLQTDGEWVFGPDNIVPEAESIWAINPLTVRHGIVCWKVRPQGSRDKAERYGMHMVPMTATKPDKTNKQAFDKDGNEVDHEQHPWVDVIGVDMVCVSEGEDKGEQVIYEPSSNGGIDVLKKYINKHLIPQIDKGKGEVVALVKLRSDSYNNKTTGGKTYFPIFEYVDWVTMDTDMVPASEPVEETTVEEPANKNSPAPETASTQEQPQEAGGERRRRRRA
jgi:hypothetical protein